ncbi:MAG: hypothetical protein LBP59_17245 [Planctomycetaceae bacterium]|nr:hypothetical protein [Planctomycetaceae bacterium]
MRLYSTADERGLDYDSFFVYFAATCNRDCCDLSQFFATKKLSHLSLQSLKKFP